MATIIGSNFCLFVRPKIYYECKLFKLHKLSFMLQIVMYKRLGCTKSKCNYYYYNKVFIMCCVSGDTTCEKHLIIIVMRSDSQEKRTFQVYLQFSEKNVMVKCKLSDYDNHKYE